MVDPVAKPLMMLAKFPNLLLQILHRDPARPDPVTLATFTPEEWDELIAEASRYRLAFQLRDYLKANPDLAERVPAASLQGLDDTIRETLNYNFCKQMQLEEMLSACAAAGIPLLVMKGLWLVENVYRDLKARHSGDIDLLVRPEDMPRFTRLVQTLGFKVPRDIGDIREITAANHEFSLFHPVTGAGFDLHWSLTHPLEEAPVDDDKFWQGSEIFTLGDQPCRSPGLEDHLLFLCFHAAIHHRFQFVGPRALLDIARVIKQPPRAIDWRHFLEGARELGWSRGTWLILDLVREHLGVQPPAGVLDGLRPEDADDPAIRAAALAAMFLDQNFGRSLGRHVVRVVSAATWRESLSILGERLFPPRRYIASYFGVKLDHPGLPWLYVKRWGMLLKRVTPGLFQLWSGDAPRQVELERSSIIAAWLRQP